MNTLDILRHLHPYQSILSAIHQSESKHISNQVLHKTLNLRYDFIQLLLRTASSNGKITTLYLQCTFEVRGDHILLNEVYCIDKSRTQLIQDIIQSHSPLVWKPADIENLYSLEVKNYISIADEIAKQGYLCDSGDHYRPGFYSGIVLEDEKIILQQTNRHNARSIDHKDDYMMRDLQFIIPLKAIGSVNTHSAFNRTLIGNMSISFSDMSSKNNKRCGDKIKAKIDEEKLKFDGINKPEESL